MRRNGDVCGEQQQQRLAQEVTVTLHDRESVWFLPVSHGCTLLSSTTSAPFHASRFWSMVLDKICVVLLSSPMCGRLRRLGGLKKEAGLLI